MTPTQRKAMEQALEKLKLISSGEDYGKLTPVMDAMSAALAEPQGEPVATLYGTLPIYDTVPQPAVPPGYKLVPVETLDRFPEINPNNYCHDDVCNLNAWGVELVLAAEAPQPAKRVPLTPESITPVRRLLMDKGVYLSDKTIKLLIEKAHSITGETQ